jgi:LAGLIDADG-like domain
VTAQPYEPPPLVFLPDGTVYDGELLGSQMPRFWTSPPRHRGKDPDCRTCDQRGYPGLGCGDYASAELLQWAPSCGYVLDPWQEWWLTEACGVKPDGRWAAFEVAAIVSRQNGKNSCSIYTPILTVSRGWVTFKDIRPGDEVYGSDGKPTRVVARTEIFPEADCYEVSFTDGATHTVSGDHLWHVLDVYNNGKRGWENLRTRDLARMWGGQRLDTGRNWYRYRVRCDAVVQSPMADLPVDPYLLGYWLGDGDKRTATLFCGKSDLSWVEGLIRSSGAEVSRVKQHPVTGVQEVAFRFGPEGLHTGCSERFRTAGVYWGCKGIPELYLSASPDQRLALLRGLMDSDGSIAITNKTPQAEFSTSDQDLAEDFWRLARSLGIRVTRHDGATSLNGVRKKDRARFLWTPAFNPFAMPRKAERWREPVSRRHEVMSITGIRPVPSVPTRCIQVDAPDGVYLVGKAFTPTHNSCLEVRELGGLYLFGESMIIHTAHEFKAAAEHFRRIRDTITAYDELSRRVKRVMTSHGDEAIELRATPTLIFGSGGRRVRQSVTSRLRFLARSRGSGRAFTASCVVYDEAMFLTDEQVGASMPTLSAVPNPQMYYTASAGVKDSVQLALVRRRITRHDPTVMGAEWSADPHLDTCPRDEVRGRKDNHYIICDRHDDRDDPRTWAKANPAFGDRIRYEHVRKEFAAMTPAQFDRERLGIGDWPAEEEAWAVVPEEAWAACGMADPGGALRPVAFAVDVNPEMTMATIAAAWERPEPPLLRAVRADIDGRPVRSPQAAEQAFRTVLEIPRGCSREGTGWLVARLAELRRQWRPVAIAIPRNGPAAAFIDAAERAGIEVTVATSADEAAAFALMVTGIRGRKVIHLGREKAPALWGAVASAETRDIGDGGRGWSRRTSEEDITPVTAVTLAYWVLNKKRRNYDLKSSVR